MEAIRQIPSGLYVVENRDAIYEELSAREIRRGGIPEWDGVERQGFAKNEAEIDFQDGSDEAVIVPRSSHGFRTSPIEANTGVPLPIIPPRVLGQANYHHAFFYGCVYNQMLEHRAVRYSRLQKASAWLHTQYHKHFDGTEYPETNEDAFRITILNSAGYVPKYGVAFENYEEVTNKVTTKKQRIIIREMSDTENKKLRKPKSFISERYTDGLQRRSIGQFIMYYALSQEFDEAKKADIQEFLSITESKLKASKKQQRRKFDLAMKLTHKALYYSVDPVRPDFVRALKSGQLKSDLEANDPWRLAKSQLNDKEPDYHQTLEGLLVNQFGAAA